MRQLSRLIALLCCLLFHLNGKAQTERWSNERLHPILKQVAAKRPGLRIFMRKNDQGGFVNMAVADETTRILKWFTCHGTAFDSVQVNNEEYGRIISGAVDPFVFYRDYCYTRLFYLERAELLYRLKGKVALEDTSYNNRIIFNSSTVKSAQTTLQKLMALEGIMKRTSLQLQLFESKSPRQLNVNTNEFKLRKDLAGLMISRADSTEYYNPNLLSTAAKIVLHRNAPDKFFVYDEAGVLLDSVPLKPGKYVSLLREKEDVFLLYRGWLEMQWQQIADNRKQYTEWWSSQDSGLYRPVSWEKEKLQFRHFMADLQSLQCATDNKISDLIMPEGKHVEMLLADLYRDEAFEVSYLPGLGFAYTISYTRGQKAYELTERRGNVMVTVSDKKKGVDENTDGVLEYYKADVISANDYYPFGMLEPGRVFKDGDNYRYGYNGKENDDEVKGTGNQQDYGLRIYDPRIGKFLSVDPLAPDFPWLSPYQFAGNTPIWAIDLDGAEPFIFGFNTPLLGAADLVETGLDVGAKAGPLEGTGPALSSVRVGPGGTMTQELPFNWTSFDVMPIHPAPYTTGKGPLLKVPNQSSVPAQQAQPQKSPQPRANPERQFDLKKRPYQDIEENEMDTEDEYIYRGGASTDANFTPRQDDTKPGPKQGWSTFTDPMKATQGDGGKVQVFSVKKLKALGFVLKKTPDGHVGVNPRTQKALNEWAATKEPIKEKKRGPHLLTKILRKAWEGEIKVPKTK